MKLHRRFLVLAALVVLSPAAFAKTCAVAIEGNDQMKFNLPTIKLAADCTQVTVTLKHTGKMAANVMGHNWVLTKTADVMQAPVERHSRVYDPRATYGAWETVYREEWVYNFGAARFMRIVHLDNGRVTDVEFGGRGFDAR